MREVLAIIPARGGSKGIPRKNVLPLAGKPLIAHTIHAARAAGMITRVVVSTDDDEIAEVSLHHGADVVRRPAVLASDTAKSEDALIHVLEHLQAIEGYHPELVAFLQCTSPLTAPEDIDGTIQALIDTGSDTAVAVTPFHYFIWKHDVQGAATGINHDKSVRLMRQEREHEFLETGAVYVVKTREFLETRHRFFGKTALHNTPVERRLEIDDPIDFELAEERMSKFRAAPATSRLPTTIAAVIFDFDGVFTDDRVFVDQDGRESVACSRSDGMGIEQLRKRGIPMIVISKEQSKVVAARCAKLQLPCHHGVDDKIMLLRSWLVENGHDPVNTLYVGNDVNDVECMQYVGCAIAPRDAHPAALAVADLILDADGGRGALRHLSDMICREMPQGGR